MGKGDKKSRRGKIVIGSFGVRRPRNKKHPVSTIPAETPAVPEKEVAKPSSKTTPKKSEGTEAEVKPKTPRGKKKTEPEEPAAE